MMKILGKLSYVGIQETGRVNISNSLTNVASACSIDSFTCLNDKQVRHFESFIEMSVVIRPSQKHLGLGCKFGNE